MTGTNLSAYESARRLAEPRDASAFYSNRLVTTDNPGVIGP
ncbi:hypothetical protein LAUMK13_02339 [Mycobacterium innocens]|uniref:Uncharacterized protein n=1 Tax=Mycobacterium innocens TaxID=2341083 RepID=A0A498Q2X2_9MYCO|nr:hypothetical protein LAUMK13_02339 [Mycobacterium innocens]